MLHQSLARFLYMTACFWRGLGKRTSVHRDCQWYSQGWNLVKCHLRLFAWRGWNSVWQTPRANQRENFQNKIKSYFVLPCQWFLSCSKKYVRMNTARSWREQRVQGKDSGALKRSLLCNRVEEAAQTFCAKNPGPIKSGFPSLFQLKCNYC